jgi:hypothetical protein
MQHYTTLMDRHGIIQINLQKSRTATNGLVAHMLDNNISLALVQEPYVCRHGSAFKIPHLNGLQLAAVTSAKFLSAIIFNKDCLQPLFVPQLSTDRIVVITAQIGQTIVYFASVYLPPSVDIRSEIPTIQRLVEATAGSRLVIGGDFNTRSTLWFDSLNDTRSPILHEFITQNDLDITNKPGTLPTFQNSRGQSFIDITLTTPSAAPNISNWQVSNSLITSDHNAISFTFTNDPAISTATTAPRQVMDYSRVTSEHVAETLQDWNSEFDRTFPALSNPETIDQAVNYLYSTIRTCVAAKAVRRKRFAHRPDWWTDEVERHRKIYMTKKSLFYKNRHPEYGNYLHTEMRAARDRFKRKLTAARQKSWDLFVQRDLTENPWGVTYRLAAEKFHKAGVLSCFTREDNSATLTPQDTLEYLLHKLLPDDDPSTNTHLQQNAQRDFTALEPLPHGAAPFTEDDLNRLIQEIKPNKAPGTDRLPGRLIKLLHPWTGRSLLRIYNACWSSGYFPQAWKRGNLVVLLKDPSGDVGSAKNYRPITLLPVYAKILEKLVKCKLTEIITPLHSQFQFGFSPGRSTTDALLSYQTAVSDSPQKYVITIFVDIRGAFDNVWWPGLLSTLRDRRLPHELLAIIKSYLTNRTVLFTQGDVTTQKRITKGCPQGSVLGPTLWNFLLDPLLNAEWPEGTKVVAYADDLAIIVAHDSRQTLKTIAQQALDLVTNWATENKLKLSTEKTVFMVHKSPPRVHQRDIRLLLYDALVKRVNNQRYLGLIIDPKFNFELNAAYATQRARSITLGLRRRAARHWGQSAPEALRTIYRGAILPILTYASPVWINKLTHTKVQRKYLSLYGTFARLLTSSYVSVSTDAAGVLAGLLPTDLEIDRANTLRALKRGQVSLFQGELITPDMFDSTAHAGVYLQLRAEDIWQSRWDNTTKGRVTHAFFPAVTTELAALPKLDFVRTQVLTGHGEFGCHLHRIGKEESDTCDICPGATDDPIHRILECPKYLAAQELIHEEVRAWPPQLTMIPALCNGQIFVELATATPSTIDIEPE